MGMRDWFKWGGRGEEPAKGPIAKSVPVWVQNVPLTPETDVRALLNEGYRRNVVTYVCIQQLASSLASLPVKVKVIDGEEVAATHPARRLLRRPNPEQGWRAFLSGVVTNMATAGDAYVHKARNTMGMPVQLWSLRPDRTFPVPGAYGYVESFEYRVPGLEPQRVPAADVVRLAWATDPLDDYRGLSPLVVAARSIDLDNKALDYLRAFFTNGASPAGILTFEEETEEKERERIRLMWRRLYGGNRGWHDVAVLDSGVKWEEMGSRPEKLGLDHVWGTTETRICAAFGVPPILVQLKMGLARSTFSNYGEAIKSFWSETMVPLADQVGDQLTFGLGAEYGDNVEVCLDVSEVEVLQEAWSEKRNAAVLLYGGDIVTLNEARAMAGLEPVEGEDGEKRKSQNGVALMQETGGLIGADGKAAKPKKDERDEDDDDDEEEDERMSASPVEVAFELPKELVEALEIAKRAAAE